VLGSYAGSLTNVTLTSSAKLVPGALAVTVAEGGAQALINAEGDLFLFDSASNYGLVELRLLVDGAVVRTLRTTVYNYLAGNLSTAWHLHTIVPLAAGSHDVRVDGRVLAANGPVQVNSTAGRISALVFVQ
jgi:hypothetical protein